MAHSIGTRFVEVDIGTESPMRGRFLARTKRSLPCTAPERQPPGALAVLVQAAPHGVQRIERYAIPDGTMVASTRVRPRGIHALDIAGKWIVYSAFHGIKLIDPLGHKQVLVWAEHRPIDVSIEGNRVAWAENGSGRHRIRAVSVPE